MAFATPTWRAMKKRPLEINAGGLLAGRCVKSESVDQPPTRFTPPALVLSNTDAPDAPPASLANLYHSF